MRILAVVPFYLPQSRVGAWLSTHACLVHLHRGGHQVDVVVQASRVRPAAVVDGLDVHYGAGNIERLANTADLLISHLGDSGRAAKAAKAARKPSVRMAHGGRIRHDPDAALIVWNSDTFRAGRPGIVVHPPVDPAAYRTTPGDMVTLVNLSEAKGVKTFWRAADRLPELAFLACRGGTGHQLAPRARNVEVVGPVADMRDVYSRTRILLAPSADETWGRVGVEAMASGIPVIAHPTPGLRESLGPAGIFIDRTDTDGWVRMIRRLATTPSSWNTASKLARKRSAELHPARDLERFANAVCELVPVAA